MASKPGRKCTVCSHPRATQINQELLKNGSYRDIAKRYEIASYGSVWRHASNCYAEQIDQAREAKAVQTVILTERAAEQWTARIEKGLTMADEWLTDPRDPSKYSLEPRAEQVVVFYSDAGELDGKGKPKQKAANLQELLDSVKIPGREIQGTRAPKVSYVNILLEFTKAGVKCLELLAKMRGEFAKRRRNPLDLEQDIAWLMESLGVPRDEAIQTLREWHPEDFEDQPGVH
jgi:hypothetical protein